MKTETSLDTALSLLDQSKPREALTVLADLAREHDTDATVHYLVGVAHYRLSNFGVAEQAVRRSISLRSDLYGAHYYLGLSLQRQGRVRQALASFREALAIDPDSSDAKRWVRELEAGEHQSDAPKQEQKASMEEPERLSEGDLVKRQHRRWQTFGNHVLATVLLLVLTIASFVSPIAKVGDVDVGGLVVGMLLLLSIVMLVVRSRCSIYEIYERRLDFVSGVFLKKHVSVWSYQIEDAWMCQSPLNVLTNDAKIVLTAGELRGTGRERGRFEIVGWARKKETRALFDELRRATLEDRRAMKRWWI